MKMSRDKRYEWLMAYIKAKGPLDILFTDFVDAYIAATGAKHEPTCWGAFHCKMLGRDLSHMAKVGALKRARTGMPSGNWQPGFPKWVWTYSVGLAAYLYETKP